MAETAGYQFFQKVLPECNEPPQATCCAFSGVKRVVGRGARIATLGDFHQQ
jgi:hypothetical protein